VSKKSFYSPIYEIKPIALIGRGGGGGASGGRNANDGGSGGGGAHNNTVGGTSTQGNTRWNGTTYIAGGFSGGRPTGSRGGGGGGAVEVGDTDGLGHGGDGFSGISGYNFMFNFGTDTGDSYFDEDNTFYGGGGGGAIPPTSSYTRSKGGGGIPNTAYNVSTSFMAGMPNTGGGGGGSLTSNQSIGGGSGGTGIVFIRFKSTKIINTITTNIVYENNIWRTRNSLWEIINHSLFYNNGNVNINDNLNTFYKLSVGGNVKCFSLDVMDNLKVNNSLNVNSSLNVVGNSLLNGRLHIIEASGTVHNPNNGSILIDHENNGGASSITFRSRANRGSDYGYIQYQDSSSVGAGGESARLIIGTSNDGDYHLILSPAGNVGIRNNDPFQKLTVSGNINASGNITSSTINANNIASGGDLSCNSLYVNNFTSVGGNQWHNGGGRPVFYFGSDGTNYYRASGWDCHNWRNNNDTTRMFLNSGGDLYCGRFINWSDTRIKKDIVDISDTEALDKILLIEPKKYKYIDEVGKGTKEVIGFIAQQIKEVIPEAVHLGKGDLPNGEIIQDFHYLDKLTIFTLNVCATQELHRIIMRQQTIIDGLILRLEVLENS